MLSNQSRGGVKRRVVYAYVVGDILHIGHVRHLQNAKRHGDYLIVGVLTDEAAMEKKPVPVIPFTERLETIGALKVVDEVMPQTTYSPLGNVERIRPDVLMESDSHPDQPANDYVLDYGGRVIVTPYYSPQSSTKIKEKIITSWRPPVATSADSVTVMERQG